MLSILPTEKQYLDIKKRLRQGTLMIWLRQVSAILTTSAGAEGLQLFFKTIVAGLLGPRLFGLYTLLQLLPQYAEKFFRFGVDDGVTCLAGKYPEQAGRYFFNAILLLCGAAAVAVISFFLLRNSFGQWVLKGHPLGWFAVAVTLLQIPPLFFLRVSTKQLLFLEGIRDYNLWLFGPPLLASVGLMVAALVHPTNLGLLAAVPTFSMLLGAVGSLYSVRRRQKLHICFDGAVVRKLFAYGMRLYVPGALAYLHFRADLLMIGIFLQPEDVGIYALAATIAQMIFRVPGAIASLLYAKASKQTAAEALRTTVTVCRYTVLSGLCVLIFLIPTVELVVWYLLPVQYFSLLRPFFVLLPAWFVVGIGHILHHYYYSIGRPRVPTVAVTVATLVNLGANALVIPQYGIVGAAWVSCVSYALFSFGLGLAFVREGAICWRDFLIPRWGDIVMIVQWGKARLWPRAAVTAV